MRVSCPKSNSRRLPAIARVCKPVFWSITSNVIGHSHRSQDASFAVRIAASTPISVSGSVSTPLNDASTTVASPSGSDARKTVSLVIIDALTLSSSLVQSPPTQTAFAEGPAHTEAALTPSQAWVSTPLAHAAPISSACQRSASLRPRSTNRQIDRRCRSPCLASDIFPRCRRPSGYRSPGYRRSSGSGSPRLLTVKWRLQMPRQSTVLPPPAAKRL